MNRLSSAAGRVCPREAVIVRLAWLTVTTAVLILWFTTEAYSQVRWQIGQNFTASTFGENSAFIPPDCNGAAGPAHFVELINGRFSIYDKATGERVQTLGDQTFWQNAGVKLGSLQVSDPRVLFDLLSQRWFAAEIDLDAANESSNRFLLAVSATADPTGLWHGLAIPADPVRGNFADFPTFGVDGERVYLAGDLYTPAGDPLNASTLLCLPKRDLLLPTPSIEARTLFDFLPYTNYGAILQPVSCLQTDPGQQATGLVVSVQDLGYDFKPLSNLVCLTVTTTESGAAALSEPDWLPVESYEVPLNPTQPNGYDGLDSGDLRFSANIYRVGDSIYATHAIQQQDRSAVRWYRIDASTHAVLESGTLVDPDLNFFYPCITANSQGGVLLGFNGCSSNHFVSCYAAVGYTQAGQTTFGAPFILKAGAANFRDGSAVISRWGDYSTASTDPGDPWRFWTIQMYPSASNTWSTQISEVRAALPFLSLSLSATSVVLSWPGAQGVLQLQATPDLTAEWSPVNSSVTMSGGVLSVQLPHTNQNRFFRLIPL